VLTVPLMRHPGVVDFIGCREEWSPGGIGTQLMIVMSYERLGCLVEYLKNNTVDWSTACRMMHSLSAGLAHLHTEITNGGTYISFFFSVDVNLLLHHKCAAAFIWLQFCLVSSEFFMSFLQVLSNWGPIYKNVKIYHML